MPRLAAFLALLLFLGAGGAAHAAEAIGWIVVVDSENDQIVLGNGLSFVVPDDINVASLNENTCVRIRFDMVDGLRVMREIAPLPSETARSACSGPALRRRNSTAPGLLPSERHRRTRLKN